MSYTGVWVVTLPIACTGEEGECWKHPLAGHLTVPVLILLAADVVVVESPQTPEDDPEKRLRMRWETGKFIDGLPKVQSPAVRVEGGATEP